MGGGGNIPPPTFLLSHVHISVGCRFLTTWEQGLPGSVIFPFINNFLLPAVTQPVRELFNSNIYENNTGDIETYVGKLLLRWTRCAEPLVPISLSELICVHTTQYWYWVQPS